MAAATRSHTVGGIQSSAVKHGGYNSGYINSPESFNGTSWTGETAAPYAFLNPFSFGSSRTSFQTMGGSIFAQSVVVAMTFLYNGTTWTAQQNIPAVRETVGGASGTVSSGSTFGGNDLNANNYTDTFEYNGTTWSVGGALVTGIANTGACGAGAQSAISMGGDTAASAGIAVTTVQFYQGDVLNLLRQGVKIIG